MIYFAGYERSTGEFVPEGQTKLIPYDNVIIHTLDTDCGVEGFVGFRSEQLKIKFKDLPRIFGCTYDELEMFKMKPIVLHMGIVNKFPKLQRITLDLSCNKQLGELIISPEKNK